MSLSMILNIDRVFSGEHLESIYDHNGEAALGDIATSFLATAGWSGNSFT